MIINLNFALSKPLSNLEAEIIILPLATDAEMKSDVAHKKKSVIENFFNRTKTCSILTRKTGKTPKSR